MSATMINLNIKDASDTEEEKQIADSLESLVHGRTDATSTAQVVEETITSALDKHPDDALNGWQKYVWDCVGKSGMAIPSDHQAQDRLVEFVQALQKVPNAEAQWSLKPSNLYRYFEQWMWELDQGHFTGGRQVENSSDAAKAYVNFSAFLARLLAAGVVEATRLSALINQPFRSNPLTSTRYTDASEAAQHYAPYARAASQWILHAGAALYEMCEKETLIEIGKQKWTPPLWAGWKAKFETIAAADRFDAETRRTASDVVTHMTKTERSGVVSNVVETFGFMSMKDDEDE